MRDFAPFVFCIAIPAAEPTTAGLECSPNRLTEAIKCKCPTEASQFVMSLNNGCSALHFPLLESVQTEKAPVKIYRAVQRRNFHKAWRTKHITKRRGVFVSPCTLLSKWIATGFSKDSTKGMPLFATFICF